MVTISLFIGRLLLRGRILALLLPALLLAGCAEPVPSGLAGVFGATPAQRLDTADTIIVYGGFGYVDRRAQPGLDRLLYLPGNRPSPTALRVGDAVLGKRFATLSAYPVVGDPDGFMAAVGTKRGIAPEQLRGQALADEIAGAKILVLSLFGSLEYDFVLPATIQGRDFPSRITLVTVTAVLSRPGSGEILLSSAAATQRSARGRAEASDTALGQDYAAAAERALASLEQQAATLRPDAPRAMVTAVTLAGSRASRLYGFRPAAAGGAAACHLADPCPPGEDTPCRKLQAALAHLATEALADGGERVLPPGDWSVWADIAFEEVQGVGVLRIATTGGWYGRDEKLLLRLEPEKAERKVVVALDEIAIDQQPDGRLLLAESFRPSLRLLAHGGSCERPTAPVALPVPDPEAVQTVKRIAGGPEIPTELARLYGIAAISRMLGNQGSE